MKPFVIVLVAMLAFASPSRAVAPAVIAQVAVAVIEAVKNIRENNAVSAWQGRVANSLRDIVEQNDEILREIRQLDANLDRRIDEGFIRDEMSEVKGMAETAKNHAPNLNSDSSQTRKEASTALGVVLESARKTGPKLADREEAGAVGTVEAYLLVRMLDRALKTTQATSASDKATFHGHFIEWTNPGRPSSFVALLKTRETERDALRGKIDHVVSNTKWHAGCGIVFGEDDGHSFDLSKWFDDLQQQTGGNGRVAWQSHTRERLRGADFSRSLDILVGTDPSGKYIPRFEFADPIEVVTVDAIMGPRSGWTRSGDCVQLKPLGSEITSHLRWIEPTKLPYQEARFQTSILDPLNNDRSALMKAEEDIKNLKAFVEMLDELAKDSET